MINNCLDPSGFRVEKLLVYVHKGTSSLMTSALDALVFVKVCNLWWVSDKVPQGRGVAQCNSRLGERQSMTRMSNLQTLIGNSFKYFLPNVPLSVGLLLQYHALWWAAMLSSCTSS